MIKNLRIAVLLEMESAFDRQLLRGIGQYARRHGPWAFHIVSDRRDRFNPPSGLWGVSGVFARLNSHGILNALSETQIPVVAIGNSCELTTRHLKRRAVTIGVDTDGIARIAADHFASRGFRQIAFVGTPVRDWSDLRTQLTQQRIVRVDPPCIVGNAEGPAKSSRALDMNLLVRWLKGLPKPIGVVASDDECGFQVLEACRGARINVPSEVAVMGVGNDELLCALANPGLSSVPLAVIEGGYYAARALDCLMRKSTPSPEQLVIPTHGLIVRSSTDADISQDPHVRAARSIIRRRCPHDVSIKALAKSVGVSRRTLELRFRKHVGRTVFEEIQDARLSKAKAILTETDLPISRVASSSGYRSVAYFIRVFGKECGLTPAKYRAASRLSEVRHNGNQTIWNSRSDSKC